MAGVTAPLRCYVRRTVRYTSGHQKHWLWFFTDPLVYSVWWLDEPLHYGGPRKTPAEFLVEQTTLARAHRTAGAASL